MKWIFTILKQYANFKDRSDRKDLIAYIIFIIILVQSIKYFIAPIYHNDIFFYLICILFIPTLALVIRRLHDQGKSSKFILLVFSPLVGWLWLGLILLQIGQPYKNKYGAPKLVVEKVKPIRERNVRTSLLKNAYMVLFKLIPTKG